MPRQDPFDWDEMAEGLPSGSAPVRNPIDRIVQLPKYTREFLEDLQ